LLSLTLWLISALACSVLNSPIDETPDLSGEWAWAQRDLTELVPPVDGNPYRVTMGQFSIRTEPRPFYCGETGIHAVILVKGCFRAEPEAGSLGVIRYVPQAGNLRHEARHAILFALGDERWMSVGH
jgi:hypothetical protein